MFNYWKILILLLQKGEKLFMIYYLKINKQTKKLNKNEKQYFQYYINNMQNDLVVLLAIL